MDKQEAQRRVFQLRRKALNSAKTETTVNKAEVRRGGLYCTHSEPLASRLGISQQRIAVEFGVSQATISRVILDHKRRQHACE